MKTLLVAVLVSLSALANETTLQPPQAVRLVKTRPGNSTAKDEVTGQLGPSKLAPMGFELGGRLMTTKVVKGQLVTAGQLLGQLDPEIIDAQVAQAEAGLSAAEAGAEMALDVSQRNAKLKEEGSVSDVQNKGAATTSKQAAAQVLVAKAGLAQARAARRRHDLKTPFAGTVIDAPDNIGGMVGPGTPVFIVMQLDPLILKTTIAESARGLVKPGLKVRVSSIGANVSTDDAVVKVVLPMADPQTRRVPVEISVPNADGRFTANTLARAVLPLGDARTGITIPATALGTAGGEHVFVVRGDTLKRIPVQVLERQQKDVVVMSPENLDQVADYPAQLVDGAKVKP